MINDWKQTLAMRVVTCLVCLAAVATSRLDAQEVTNRTLLGNKAVQKELRLTGDQSKSINEILSAMEVEIDTAIKAASEDGEKISPKQKNAIIDPLIELYANRAAEVLDANQKGRLWQIGAQAVGAGVFNHKRTRQVVQLSIDQIRKMQTLHSQMAERITKAAVDPNLKINELLDLRDQENQKLFADCRELLSLEQQKSLDELLGTPFDLRLLKNPDGKNAPSLTFVFDLTWRNAHSLFADPKLREKSRFTREQTEKMMAIFKQQDAKITAIRLGILKGLPVDFSELNDEEKKEIACKILDGAREVFRETDALIAEILQPGQFEELDRRLAQITGVRAVGSERIASKLDLTADQKRSFGEAEKEHEQKTASLRVVRTKSDFDQAQEQKLKEQFISKITAILTPDQVAKLDSFATE